MKVDKYLLYIDFLGFSDLVDREPDRVAQLYLIIDSLNVHQHKGFKVIAFSDTVLVYNRFELASRRDHEYAVMYACEFVQDLTYRLAGRDLHFRALLCRGDFQHYDLPHTECFFGNALVRAYRSEKQIPAVGMFITDACNIYNTIYPAVRFGPDLHFVFVAQSLERLHFDTGGILPVDVGQLTYADDYPHVVGELLHLHGIYRNSRLHPDPVVRAKHLATYDLYRARYPDLILALEAASFRPEAICPSFDWSDTKARFDAQRP